MKLEFSRQIFEKSSNIKFLDNPSSCSMRMDRRTDMTKLTAILRTRLETCIDITTSRKSRLAFKLYF